ncbi:MAG: DNA primase [Desulfobacteraceae bacterium 4572_123]|nr:MAG: DNA primase [Desulfobacteraceae bacterium 4572_123]
MGALANFIPEETIRTIENAADIIEIVSESVVLKKAGKNYVGLCPFHSEKTPSFTVNPDKQIFHCFGCGVGGNIFNFLMKQDGMSFPDAVRMLARRCGIEIPTPQMAPAQKRRISEKENLYALNRRIMEFYQHMLMKSTKGDKARKYLNRRGMTDRIIESFKLGYAPGSWDSLVKVFSKNKMPQTLIQKSGMIVTKENSNRTWDRFRDRIIFPIFNSSMQIIGFGGRVMDDSLPKYLNSPETPVYNKSRSLYGLHAARRPARVDKKIYIAEGYFDVLALHQHRIANAVATLGTSMTAEHVRILKGIIGKQGQVILVYDSDAAGIKAARRSIELFKKEYVDARIMVLPTGHDPDSYLLEFGSERFVELAGHALGIIPFLIDSAVKKHGLSIEGKIRIIADLLDTLAAIGDDVERSLYIKDLAERIGVDEVAIIEKVRKISKSEKNKLQVLEVHGKNGPVDKKSSGGKGIRLEKQIIAMLLQFPEIVPEIIKRNVIDHFEDKNLRSIGKMIILKNTAAGEKKISGSERNNSGRIADILSSISEPEIRSTVISLIIEDVDWDQSGCNKLLTQFENSCKRGDNDLLKEIRAAENNNDHALLLQLLKQKQIQARKKYLVKNTKVNHDKLVKSRI